MTERADPHLRQSDAFTAKMERDPVLRSTIVAVTLYDRAPDWELLTDRVERATRLARPSGSPCPASGINRLEEGWLSMRRSSGANVWTPLNGVHRLVPAFRACRRFEPSGGRSKGSTHA